jgi:uncharacterized protein YaaQ
MALGATVGAEENRVNALAASIDDVCRFVSARVAKAKRAWRMTLLDLDHGYAASLMASSHAKRS